MPTDTHFDLIVLGLGGVGSSAAYHAAQAGFRVLGIDQYGPAHDRGSSHGQTRVIRQAYFESPDYVPLLKHAYTLWKLLEDQVGYQLYHPTGIVEIGPADGVVIPGVLRSAAEHRLAIDVLPISEVHKRWSGLRGDDQWSAVLERDAGYLLVEACVSAHLQAAAAAGASCRHDERVRNWQSTANRVMVETDLGQYTAERLIIAAGPWSKRVLAAMKLPLRVLRKHQYWLRTDQGGFDQDQGFPCFFFETAAGYFYGFPSRQGSGVKVARHSGGELVEEPTELHQRNSEDYSLVCDFVTKHLPGVSTEQKSWSGCYYTMTPSEHFIIDTLPDHPQVTVVAGLSGHGYKFVSVLGEIAVGLATGRTPPYDLRLFQLPR